LKDAKETGNHRESRRRESSESKTKADERGDREIEGSLDLSRRNDLRSRDWRGICVGSQVVERTCDTVGGPHDR